MSLKLIKDAALVATLSKQDIDALSVIKNATGASTLAEIVKESFTPSDDDFETWLRVVVGEAGDRGINIGKKSNFMQLAMDVLENDPAMPPIEMQEMIAKKLWQDYNSARDAVRIGKIAAAKEEEEKVEAAKKRIAQRFAQGPVTHTTTNPSAYDEEEMSDAVADFLRKGGKIQQIPSRPPRQSERLQGSAHIGKTGERAGRSTTGKSANTMGRPVIGMSKVGREEEESGFEQAFNAAKGIEDEEHTSFLSDVLRSHTTRAGVRHKSSLINHLCGFEDEARAEDDLDPDLEDGDVEVSFGPDGVEGVSDDEVFTSSDDECECPCADATSDEMSDELDDVKSEFDDTEMGPPEDELDDDTMDDIDADVEDRAPKKGFDEEEAVKSFFRQAVTSPNDMMRQAVKDIEAEGQAAWKKANVPTNPHPKKSQAYRAWQKGLLGAAKEALGIVDKPTDSKAKPKRKK